MSIYPIRSVYRNMFVAVGETPQEIDTVSDSFIESLFIFGDEGKIRDHLLEMLSMGVDELTIGLFPIPDAAQERTPWYG